MGNSVSDSVSGGSSQSHLARGRFEGGSRSFRASRRSNEEPDRGFKLKKCRSCLTPPPPRVGAGYDWTRAGARASRVDPRTGAGGGSGGCARHRDRSADSGGRHGDGRRRRASRMGRCRMGFSPWLTLRSTSFRVRPCVRLRFCDRPLHVASSTNQSRAWHF